MTARRPTGGGGARHPASIANISPAPSPASAGNRRAVTHGAHTDVSKRARELADQALVANPHLSGERDGAALARYGSVLARIERVHRWLAAQDDDVFADVVTGEVWPVLTRLERWEGAAAAAERRLAIDPLTRARLGLTTAAAFDLARYWAEHDGERSGNG